ncbi:MAG: endonuclease V [Candidatus Bathyarchaeota archaeon]|nr:endonuclease V [Candidatus Bathyarchaeota archaeon]MDW8040209.1 endonuclease V [Nitrososphaerota archaeon]
MPNLKPVFSIEKAHKAQLQLSKFIVFEDRLPKNIHFVGGVDTAYFKDVAISASVVLEFNNLNLVEAQVATRKVAFPYIPTLLSFRELPSTLACIKKLKIMPDIFLVDGQGIAHPYRCGFASHLGVVLGKPTIGVAKSRLTGDIEPFPNRDFTYLKDNNEVVGAALRTPTGKTLYVSVGHMISLETAIKIVRHCTRGSIPEPIRLAHKRATTERRKISKP